MLCVLFLCCGDVLSCVVGLELGMVVFAEIGDCYRSVLSVVYDLVNPRMVVLSCGELRM